MDKQIPRQEIFLAAQHGNVKGLTILEKDFGIECLKIIDDEGFTLMSYAAANGHESVIRYLTQKGLDCNAPNLYGWSPLMQAAYYGWLPAVGRLLESGARVNDVNNLGTTALLCASKNGYYSIAEMLIKQGAEVNVPENNNCGFTPLMAACQSGNEQMVRLLLTYGANPNAKLKGSGWTALMLASLNNHKEIVKILLANGADKECANACGKNALVICCEVENNEIATLLHGGKPYKMEKKRGSGSSTAKKNGKKVDLFEAAKQGNVVTVNELITANKQAVHAVDKDGATPLMFAAMRGHTEVCRALINEGSKVDAQDYRSGWTAFMQAVHHRQHEVAKLLIECGADVNLRSTNGCGAFEVATFNGDTEMIQLIASTAMGKKSNSVKDNKEKARSRKVSLQEKRSRLKAVKPIEEDSDLIFESPGKHKETEFLFKKHQSDFDLCQSPMVKVQHHSCSMEAADEQVVPAPPDFSVSPSPSVLLDRVCKALNMDVPKTSEASDVNVQRFPSPRQQQAKVESDFSPPNQRTDHVKPAESKPNWSSPNAKVEVTNQNPPVTNQPIRSTVDPSPLVRRAMAPSYAAGESDRVPPVKRSDLPGNIPQPVPTTVDYPKQSTTPTTTNPFQKFLMKKTAQPPGGGGAPNHAKAPQDSVDSSPKPTRSSLVTDMSNGSLKQAGLSRELPPSILNRIAKNVRSKPSRPQYGNIASSGDLIANLAMKYGKQPGGGAVRVQDPIPAKPQPIKPAPPPVTTDQVITEASDLADVLKQFSLKRFIPIFEEHEVDMATFLSMTNTDLEEVGITDAEEKLNILDAIVEIKDRTPASLSGGKKATRNIPSSFAYQNLHQWS